MREGDALLGDSSLLMALMSSQESLLFKTLRCRGDPPRGRGGGTKT